MFRIPVRIVPWIVLLAAAAARGQTTWHVDASAPGGGNGSPSSPFTSIPAGINAAANGYRVLAHPGTYVENIAFFGNIGGDGGGGGVSAGSPAGPGESGYSGGRGGAGSISGGVLVMVNPVLLNYTGGGGGNGRNAAFGVGGGPGGNSGAGALHCSNTALVLPEPRRGSRDRPRERGDLPGRLPQLH